MRVRTKSPTGFTLIEILIVVVILGILSAVVVPQFSNASHVARENTMREDLRYMRTQIMAFRIQHLDVCPGYPGGSTSVTPTAAAFLDQMTSFTNDSCATRTSPDPNYPYGPYLSILPINPLSAATGMWIVTGSSMPAPDANQPYAWIYNPELQKFIANVPGSDANGVPYANY